MAEAETKQTFELDIENIPEFLFNIMCGVRGIDPKSVQGVAKLMNVDSVDETTYYPNQLTSLAIAQLRAYGKALYPSSDTWNEYEFLADIIGISYKGFKGFKSNQYVEVTSGQQNLEKLQGMPEDTRKGILSGLFNRGGKE